MKIAFIGLGNMGGPMALNLKKAGHEVQAFDLSKPACDKFAAEGLAIAASAAEAVRGVQAVISMLPASQHVESLYLGESGLLAQLPAGTLVIDCSTIAAASAQKVAKAAAALGLPCIDAPVSGGTGGAIAGTLTFMVGGDDAALALALPLRVANGLDPKVLSEIMRRSSGGNWALEKYNPMPGVMETAPASKGYAGGFGTDLMLKDLGLAQENATAVKASTPLGGLARSLYAAHSLGGQGALDFSSVIRLFQKG